MPNRRYERGRRAEYKAIDILEVEGYTAHRAASSKGIFDIFGLLREIDPYHEKPILRCIQVKAGRKITQAEREAIEDAIVPPLSSKEIWRFIDRQREPEIEYVR